MVHKAKIIDAIKDDFKEIKKMIALGAHPNEPTARHSLVAGEKTCTTDEAIAELRGVRLMTPPSPKLNHSTSKDNVVLKSQKSRAMLSSGKKQLSNVGEY